MVPKNGPDSGIGTGVYDLIYRWEKVGKSEKATNSGIPYQGVLLRPKHRTEFASQFPGQENAGYSGQALHGSCCIWGCDEVRLDEPE